MREFARSRLSLLAFAVATVARTAFCQTNNTGAITGTVTDPTTKVLVAASVQLKSIDTGELRTVETNHSGVYRFVFVRPGTYEISGRYAGLQSDAGRLIVAVGQVQNLDLHLKLEQPKSVVLVTDGAPLLNTDNAHFVYTLSTQQLELLPLPGRDLASVAYSAPGVVINTVSGSGNFVFQGLGAQSNLFTMNGIDVMDPYYNTQSFGVSGMLLGLNEVKEASIIQNPFEGQYGRQAGAQVNYVTKSGSNNFHGNLLHSYNGTQLNANDFFLNAAGTPRPLAISNQYAASLGGTIRRNKLFFFLDTEGLRFTLPTSNHVAAIPSQALANYALRRIQPSQASLYQKMFNLYNNAPGHERAVPVTNGGGIFQDKKNRLGCGNLAGASDGMGGVFGVDVSCAQAWETNSSALTKEWLLSSRVDYNLSANQRLFFRYKMDRGMQPSFTSDVSPKFDAVLQGLDYQGQVSHTMVITPRLVNHAIGSVVYHTYVRNVRDLAAALEAFPMRINFGDGGANGGPIASIGANSQTPQGQRAGQYQLVDDISYNLGRHSLKAGMNYRHNPTDDLQTAINTQFGRYTSLSMDEFASGELKGRGFYVQWFSPNPTLHVSLGSMEAYVQDQWAVTRQLKITAAVRFDHTGNPDCAGGCFSRLVAPFPELNKGLSIPYNQSLQTGVANPFYSVEYIVPQPRLSFVYAPKRLKSTVFRGGIGLFYDLYASYFAGLQGQNPPNVFQTLNSIRTGLINASGAGSAAAIAATSANAFATAFASGQTLPQLQRSVAPVRFFPPFLISMPLNLKATKSLQWTLEVQRQLSANDVLTLRYIGNRGYDIFINDASVNASAAPAVFPNGFPGLPATAPDPRFGEVDQYSNTGTSNYHGLITNYRHAYRRGLQGQISYTWSHALDTVSNGGVVSFSGQSGVVINPANLRSLNYSNADYDVRHNLTGDLIWDLPFRSKRKASNALIRGWSMGARLSAHSGMPFSVLNPAIAGLSNFGGTVLADMLSPVVRMTCGREAVASPCLTASQFVAPDNQANFGNLPRNSFRGPRYLQFDSSLYKSVPIRENLRVSLGASAYNTLNHPNFGMPGSDVSLSGLGSITSTSLNPSGPLGAAQPRLSGRMVVVTAKLIF